MIVPTLAEVRKEKFRRSYYEFLKYFWDVVEPHKFQDNPHIKYLCDEVQQVFAWAADFSTQEEAYDLVINISPGTSKSSIVSKFGPAYAWVMNPDMQIIATSYSSSAVKPFTTKFKKLLASKEFKAIYPDLELEEDNMGTQRNKDKGERHTTSTDGSVTGMHGDIVMVDDHNKPPKLKRDHAGNTRLQAGATLTEILNGNSWHDDVLTSRKTDLSLSRTIYVQQRVHKQDLSGYLLEKAKSGAKNIKHICLPAEIGPNDKAYSKLYIRGKLKETKDLSSLYEDKILVPKRMGRDTLNRTKADMGVFAFQAQYLQRPTSEQGYMIKPDWFPIVPKNDVPDNLVRFFYTDPSEGKKNSDNMATVAWSLWEGKAYIWNIMAVVKQFHEFIGYRNDKGEWIEKVYDKFITDNGGSRHSTHFFEAKSSGSAYIQYMNAHSPYNVVEDMPKGSKSDRVSLSQGILEAGKVVLVGSKDNIWIQEFLYECANFTGQDGDQDDRIDVLTGLIKLTDFNNSIFEPEEVHSEEKLISF